MYETLWEIFAKLHIRIVLGGVLTINFLSYLKGPKMHYVALIFLSFLLSFSTKIEDLPHLVLVSLLEVSIGLVTQKCSRVQGG